MARALSDSTNGSRILCQLSNYTNPRFRVALMVSHVWLQFSHRSKTSRPGSSTKIKASTRPHLRRNPLNVVVRAYKHVLDRFRRQPSEVRYRTPRILATSVAQLDGRGALSSILVHQTAPSTLARGLSVLIFSSKNIDRYTWNVCGRAMNKVEKWDRVSQ